MSFISGYFWNRINEVSTVRGLILLVSGIAGWDLSTSQTEAIVAVALAIVGLIAALFPDRFRGRSRKTDLPAPPPADRLPDVDLVGVPESPGEGTRYSPMPPVDSRGQALDSLRRPVRADREPGRRLEPDSRQASGDAGPTGWGDKY